MTESVRRRKSKWDIKGETNNEIREDNVWSGRAGGSNHGKESQSDWDSSKIADNHGPKWSNMDATTAVQSKDISGWSCVPLPGNFEQKDENVNRDCDEILETTITWGGDQNYSTSMSPGLDGWREQNHGHSPNSSLSRSRRSRSRSPPHGFKHESEGWNDRTRSESVVSGPPCRDFAVGWCTRGSQCRFYHHDNHDHEGRKQSGSASSESWGSRHGRGASSVHAETEEQRDYSQDRTSHGYGIHHDETQKHETQRNDRPAKKCFEFLKGKCYRGSSCKYAHHSTSADDNVTGERAYDRRDVNEHRREPPRRIKDVLCKYFTSGNCHHGEYCKFSHGSPEGKSRDDKWGHDLDNGLESCGGTKWSHKPPGSLHEGLQGMSQDDSLHFSLDGENRSRGGSKWSDKPTAGGICASTQLLSENNGASTTAPQSIGHGHDQQTSQPWTPNEIISTISHPTTVMAQPTASENAYTLQHPSLRGTAPTAAAFPYGYGNTVTKSAQPPNQTNFFANIPPTMVSGTGEIFSQNGPTIAPQIFTRFTMNGQPQQNNFQPSSISHHQMPCHQEESIKKPDTTDSKMSQMTSATLMTQNIVTSDQASQITNISASLAQLLENCQQLPQLYAVLNPPSATEVVPSVSNSAAFVTPMAAPFIQPSQAAWSKKPYDPNSNNIELSNLVNPVEPTITASEELGAPSKSFAQSSGNFEPHRGDRFKIGGSEEKFHHESHESKQLEPVAVSKAEDASERASDQIKEQQETVHINDMEVDDQIDEGKRSKDGKGMRMFKFSLVEFVKEILKPTWKEGQMSKEAHKTIVKKAVDKVTGTIQGAQIPQTQEKIDQYLSNCKPKLTKLVQAYVEKYLKI